MVMPHKWCRRCTFINCELCNFKSIFHFTLYSRMSCKPTGKFAYAAVIVATAAAITILLALVAETILPIINVCCIHYTTNG